MPLFPPFGFRLWVCEARDSVPCGNINHVLADDVFAGGDLLGHLVHKLLRFIAEVRVDFRAAERTGGHVQNEVLAAGIGAVQILANDLSLIHI